MKPLNVMVLESDHDVADTARATLAHAGHRVMRCHEPGAPAFPCAGVASPDACPLARGVDVALVVRDCIHHDPTAFENGVGCAIRAQVPVVELSPGGRTPFAGWLTGRIDGDLDAAVRFAAESALGDLREQIWEKIHPVLMRATVADCDVEVRIHSDEKDLKVDLVGPIDPSLSSALAVRVSDAVRASGRQFRRLGVAVTTPEHPCV